MNKKLVDFHGANIVRRAENQGFWNLFLIFSMLFISNLSSFVYVIWLNPQFVLFETIVWGLITCLCIWLLYRQERILFFTQYFRKNWIIFPFLLFAGFSVFWSINWQITLFRWVILISTIITGTFMGIRYDINELIKILTIFGIFILFLSTLLALLVPGIGVMNYYSIQGAWKGLFWHKNHLGIIATLFNAIILFNLINSIQSRTKHTILLGLAYLYSLLVLYKTESVGSYMTTILLHSEILLGYLLTKFHQRIKKTYLYSIIALLILSAIIMLINMQGILSLFGRNSSLTGRIPMWGYLFETYFPRHPLIGYGFNAFWYDESHRVFLQQAAGYPDPIVIADNGFIDLIINNGIIGFALFFLVYLGAWWRSTKVALKEKTFTYVFPIILMSYTIIANVSWSLIYENENFILLVIFAVLYRITHQDSVIKSTF